MECGKYLLILKGRRVKKVAKQTGVGEAVAKAGSQAELAAALGVSAPAMSYWVKRGWVPLRRAQQIETLYGVPRARTMSPRVLNLVSSAAEL